MRQPRSYIVRIYRQGARSLAGVVEDTSTGEQRAFSSMRALWTLIRRPSGKSTPIQAEKKPA